MGPVINYTQNTMNVYVFSLIFVILIGVVSVFFGYTKSIGKSFDNNQPNSSIESSKSKKQQKDQAQDVEEQRRAYMEDVQQKMRDSQRR